MHVAHALVYRPKYEIGLLQNPSLTSQKVTGTFLSAVERFSSTGLIRVPPHSAIARSSVGHDGPLFVDHWIMNKEPDRVTA